MCFNTTGTGRNIEWEEVSSGNVRGHHHPFGACNPIFSEPVLLAVLLRRFQLQHMLPLDVVPLHCLLQNCRGVISARQRHEIGTFVGLQKCHGRR